MLDEDRFDLFQALRAALHDQDLDPVLEVGVDDSVDLEQGRTDLADGPCSPDAGAEAVDGLGARALDGVE